MKKEVHVKKIKPRTKIENAVNAKIDAADRSRAGKKCAPIDGT